MLAKKLWFVATIISLAAILFACGDSKPPKGQLIKDMKPGDIGWVRAWYGGGVLLDKNNKAWIDPEQYLSKKQDIHSPIEIARLKNGGYKVELPYVERWSKDIAKLPIGKPTPQMIQARKFHRGIVEDMDPGEERWTNARALQFDKENFAWINLKAPAYPRRCCPGKIKIWRAPDGGFQTRLNPEDERHISSGQIPEPAKFWTRITIN